MKNFLPIMSTTRIRLLTFMCALFLLNINTSAQSSVTSLSYQTPIVAVANETTIYLSPNHSGNASEGYSISPALPNGLNFDTNTGIISGIPTEASLATNHTITAIGAINSTSYTLNLEVTNNYFDNENGQINFGGPDVTVIRGDNGSTIANTANTSYGRSAGDIVVYKNVVNLGGTSIDCIVTTVSSNVSSWTAYDQHASSGSGYNNNSPEFFSPQVRFPATNGKLVFNFQFILGDTYSTTTRTGRRVVLLNAEINSYDIDGNGQQNSQQSTEFSGFSSYSLGTPTNILPPVLVNNLTSFKSFTTDNVSDVIDPETRVRVKYNHIGDFTVSLGGGGIAYFFLDFGSGPTFETVQETTPPSVDLNRDLTGVNNNSYGCDDQLRFTPNSPQTNVIYEETTADITQLTVSFPTNQILDGVDEELWIEGTGAGNTTIKIPLNNNFSSGYSFTLGTIDFNSVEATTASGVRTIVFKSVNGAVTNNLTREEAEVLLDALSYINNSSSSTNGTRDFTVNVFTKEFRSPDAIFSATVNCVNLAGHIYHDVNGMVDEMVNATGVTQFSTNQIYAVLVDPSNNEVQDVKGVTSGGAYDFGTVNEGQYAIYVSTTAPAIGSSFNTANFPVGYAPTGEHLGDGPGSDSDADGMLYLTIGSTSITEANFALQMPPTTTNTTIPDLPNPGGFNNEDITNVFSYEDLDGTVDSITITSFPDGANYLKIGDTYYISTSSTCPPQVTCTTWPGSVTVEVSAGVPTKEIAVDPSLEGNTTVVVEFEVWDNAKVISNNSDLTLEFLGAMTYSNISGNVWNDANGNGLQEGSESLVSPNESGTQLFALLVQTNNTYSGEPTILSSSVVDPTTGYSFANVPESNDYVIRIVSLPVAPVIGSASSLIAPELIGDWKGVSTNADGLIESGQNTDNLLIEIVNLSGTIDNLNFGIQQKPTADPKTFDHVANNMFSQSGFGDFPTVGNYRGIPANSAGLTGYEHGGSLSGTDPEDCPTASACNTNTGTTFVIETMNTNTKLFYDFGGTTGLIEIDLTGGAVSIENFDVDKLAIYGLEGSGTVENGLIEFTYTIVDAAGVKSDPASYTISTISPLPIKLVSFDATKKGQVAVLDWITASEENNKGFDIERSADGKNWKQIGFVATQAEHGNSSATLNYQFVDEQPLLGANLYRLKQVDIDGSFDYSKVRQLVFDGLKNVIQVYPNPAQDYVIVDGLNSKTTIHVVNVVGQEVLKQTSEYNTIILHINQLPSGMYYIHILQDGVEVQVEKVMITK